MAEYYDYGLVKIFESFFNTFRRKKNQIVPNSHGRKNEACVSQIRCHPYSYLVYLVFVCAQNYLSVHVVYYTRVLRVRDVSMVTTIKTL